jgi:hypothetical protein
VSSIRTTALPLLDWLALVYRVGILSWSGGGGLHLGKTPSLPYSSAVFTFIETKLFTRLLSEHLTDEEYLRLQAALVRDPTAGAVIPGSGGVRKLRWALPGRGKRGGLRVIYYLRSQQGVIWMLTLYSKSVAENIPTAVLRRIRQEIDNG